MLNIFSKIKTKTRNNKIIYISYVTFIKYSRLFLGLHNSRSLINNFFREKVIKKEIRSIKKILKCKKKFHAIIVFDCKDSPPTIGDFFNVVMLARYFQKKGLKVLFFIIVGEFRESWMRLNKKSYKSHISNIVKISKDILGKKQKIEVLDWNQFSKRKFNNSYITFHEKIFKREAIYPYSFNMLNYLCSYENKNFVKKFLLKKDDFIDIKDLTIPKKKYITVHCRHARKDKNNIYSNKISQGRNLKGSEFFHLSELLRKKFPNYNIMVVSDKTGCKFFKKICIQKKFKFIFSKDFSNSFVGDGALILNSRYYFQLWGGGMCVFTYFSNLPYVRCTTTLNNEKPWAKHQLAYWHNKNNFLIENDNRVYSQFLSHIKNLN